MNQQCNSIKVHNLVEMTPPPSGRDTYFKIILKSGLHTSLHVAEGKLELNVNYR